MPPSIRLLAAVAPLLLGACSASRPARYAPPALHTPSAVPAGAPATLWGDLKAAPHRLASDTAHVFGDPWTYLPLAIAGGFAILHENYLEDREAEFFRKHSFYGHEGRDFFAALGNGATLYAGAVAWYATALALGDEELHDGSTTVLSSLTITSAATLLLKATIPDGRPGGGKHDFPSGHSSLSMSVAASLDELYGHAVGFPAYLLSGLVGLQRLDTQKHDSGAVLFGWTLGWLIGHGVASKQEMRVLGGRVEPWLEPELGIVGLGLTFER